MEEGCTESRGNSADMTVNIEVLHGKMSYRQKQEAKRPFALLPVPRDTYNDAVAHPPRRPWPQKKRRPDAALEEIKEKPFNPVTPFLRHRKKQIEVLTPLVRGEHPYKEDDTYIEFSLATHHCGGTRLRNGRRVAHPGKSGSQEEETAAARHPPGSPMMRGSGTRASHEMCYPSYYPKTSIDCREPRDWLPPEKESIDKVLPKGGVTRGRRVEVSDRSCVPTSSAERGASTPVTPGGPPTTLGQIEAEASSLPLCTSSLGPVHGKRSTAWCTPPSVRLPDHTYVYPVAPPPPLSTKANTTGISGCDKGFVIPPSPIERIRQGDYLTPRKGTDNDETSKLGAYSRVPLDSSPYYHHDRLAEGPISDANVLRHACFPNVSKRDTKEIYSTMNNVEVERLSKHCDYREDGRRFTDAERARRKKASISHVITSYPFPKREDCPTCCPKELPSGSKYYSFSFLCSSPAMSTGDPLPRRSDQPHKGKKKKVRIAS